MAHSNKKRYFPNLNGVRCIAALMVVFHHLEQAKHAFGIDNFYDVTIVKHAGRLGVGLFFVVSGFLITYLLLEEKGRFGDIDAKKFYLRRIFRIWPIYFLIIALSLFVFPHLDLLYFPGANEKLTYDVAPRLALLVVVLPNYAFVLYDLPYWCAQTWSIGVEEQFYYLWPWIIKYPKKSGRIIVLFLAVSLLLLLAGTYLLDKTDEEKITVLTTFLGQFRIQTMALGGLCAYMVYKQYTKILDFIFRKDVQIVVYTFLIILFFSGIHFSGFLELYAFFFSFFVLNVSCNPNTIISLDNKIMSYLGKITYGLYLYHVFVIVFIINALRIYAPQITGTTYHVILYVLTFVLSVAVTALSFSYFEKPLLAFKDKHFGR